MVGEEEDEGRVFGYLTSPVGEGFEIWCGACLICLGAGRRVCWREVAGCDIDDVNLIVGDPCSEVVPLRKFCDGGAEDVQGTWKIGVVDECNALGWPLDCCHIRVLKSRDYIFSAPKLK